MTVKTLKIKIKKNKTRKNKVKSKAICVLVADKSNVSGIVRFTQYSNKVKVSYEIKGLSDGLHGFHGIREESLDSMEFIDSMLPCLQARDERLPLLITI